MQKKTYPECAVAADNRMTAFLMKGLPISIYNAIIIIGYPRRER